jgi:membrane protease subunit HflK
MPFDKIKGGWDQRPPSVDEILEKAGKFFKGGSLLVLSLVILALVAFVLFEFSYYTVGPNEVGMIQRFGKYVGQTTPGPHLKWPIVERVTKVKVDYIYSEEFGLRTINPGVRTEYASGRAFREESLMLTGDLNSAVVPWIVQYRVSEPYKYSCKRHWMTHKPVSWLGT